MRSEHLAFVSSWSIPPAATFAIALWALVYLRGWWLLRRAGAGFLPGWRAAACLSGLGLLWTALASPLDVFNGFLLTAHMLQHMLLMMVAPPLILLGVPLIPVVRGLPRFAAREFAGPMLNWPVATGVGCVVTNPIVASLLMGIAMFLWHIPSLYELALRSSSWHQLEHATFFMTALMFWWPVVQPWPSRGQWPRWAIIPYLLVADLQNTALSAMLAFSDRVLYSSYSAAPRLFGFSPLEDQVAAGAIMWVAGSVAFIVPAVAITIRCLSKRSSRHTFHMYQTVEGCAATSTVSRFRFGLPWGSVKMTGKWFEAISFLVLFAAASLSWAWLASRSTDSDDLTLRLSQQTGSLAVAVFAAPGDSFTRSSEFAILVQDRNNPEVLLDAEIKLTGHREDKQETSSTVIASHQNSQNKLLQSAALNLPTVGSWLLDISVRSGKLGSDLSLPLTVVNAESVVVEAYWPYFAVLALSAALVLVYMRRHPPDSSPQADGHLPPSPPNSANSIEVGDPIEL
jgi:cytochrome c oxidase assembly factor CtaG